MVKITPANIVEVNHVCLFRLIRRVTNYHGRLGLNKIKPEELKTQGHLTFFLVDLLFVKIVMFYYAILILTILGKCLWHKWLSEEKLVFPTAFSSASS